VTPTYTAVHHVLTNPAYAGAYAYGKTRQERRVDETGTVHQRRRRLAASEWEVLIPEHHKGFLDWATWQANQVRIAANTRPVAHAAGEGAVRDGTALLQGIAVCGNCGRKLADFYQGRRTSTPGYYCTGTGQLVEDRGVPASACGWRRDRCRGHRRDGPVSDRRRPPAGARPPARLLSPRGAALRVYLLALVASQTRTRPRARRPANDWPIRRIVPGEQAWLK
jgi:hypothetical protein